MLCFCPKRLGPTRRRTQSSKDREELEVPHGWSAPATVSRPSDSSPPPCRGRNPSAPPHVFTSTPTRRLRLYALCRLHSRTVSSPPPHPPDPPTSPACGDGYDTFLSSPSDGSGRIFIPRTPSTAASSHSAGTTSKRRVQRTRYSAGTSTTCADGHNEDDGRKSASSSSNSLSSLGSRCSAVGGQDGDDEQYGRVVEGASSDAESFRCAGAAALERAWEAKRLALVLATGL
ncbi:hypothetical protein JCM10450v2_001674 [Rhodotorula kratochvilovae]